MNLNKMKFGSHIRDIRLKKRIGQRELATKIGIAASYLNDIEKNKRTAPKITVVNKISKILEIAELNIHSYRKLLTPRNNILKLKQSDLFSVIDFPSKLDFVISNPPYIPSENITELQTEVSQFEPRTALDGGRDGLFFYRYLLDVAIGMLKSDGKMILEIGFDQQPALKKLQSKFPAWTSSNFITDLQKNFRVWILSK